MRITTHKIGDIIWVLLYHWKSEGPLSSEIYCGEVELSNQGQMIACNNDYIGYGTQSWLIWEPDDTEFPSSYDKIEAWLPYNELILPEWLARNDKT